MSEKLKRSVYNVSFLILNFFASCLAMTFLIQKDTPQYKMRFLHFYALKMRNRLKKMGKSTFELLENTLFEKKLTKKCQIIIFNYVLKCKIHN